MIAPEKLASGEKKRESCRCAHAECWLGARVWAEDLARAGGVSELRVRNRRRSSRARLDEINERRELKAEWE